MSSVVRDPDPFVFDSPARDEIALFLAKCVLSAGPAVMEEYDRGCEVSSKQDGSPVTSADRRAEAIICERLASVKRSPPICAEEAMAAGARPRLGDRFLLVDPLDGTREFLANNGEFTINVALIEQGAPIAGAVYAPAIGRLWVGGDTAFVCEARIGTDLPGEGSRRRIRTRLAPSSLTAFLSRSHLDAEFGFLPQKTADRRDAVRGVVAKVLSDRRGSRRCLSTVRANHGMGHGRGRRGPARSRRRCSRPFGTPALVRQSRERIAQWAVHRLG